MSSGTRPSGTSGTHRSSANATSKATGSAGDASGLLPTLQGHVDELRAHIMCGICIRPLYEPFTIACGHTFCYSCLSAWFNSNKTCPDCRSPVKAQPAPAYLIRTLVNIFTTRPELLETGETTADHRKHQREETQRVDRDKADPNSRTGGLFKGAFQSKAPIQQPVFDLEDNVFRCPHCSWELEEDSACVQCGYHPDEDASVTSTGTGGGGSDSEDNSEMTDYLDDEAEDGFDEIDDHGFVSGFPAGLPPARLLDHLYGLEFASGMFDNQLRRNGDIPHRGRGIPFFPVRDGGRRIAPEALDDDDVDEEEDEEEDYEDADMDSFIEDDINGGEYDPQSDRSTVLGDHEPSTQDHYDDSRLRAEAPMSDDDSSDLDEDAPEDEASEANEDEDGDEDENEDRVQPPPSRRIQPFNDYSSRNPWVLHPPARLQHRAPERSPSAGSSIYSAINVDDESDEGPVGPVRRPRDRAHYRTQVY